MTDKVHFDDLTKVNVPFGLLDDDTQERLKAWPNGPEWYDYDGKWKTIYPSWNVASTYRAKPATVTQDVYPWDAMPDWVEWCARDEGGEAWAFPAKPDRGDDCWIALQQDARIDDIHKAYKRGTCDWKDSLQQRPPSPPQL